MSQLPWLSLIIWIPLIAGILFLFINTTKSTRARQFGMLISLLVSVISTVLWATAASENALGSYAERVTWIPTLGVDYSLSMDGLSGLMLLLTGLIMPFAFGASMGCKKAYKNEARYFGCLLIIQGSLLGVFTATNFFLWFCFYEISLVPAFFLIKIWGSAGKDRSSMRFFVYSMAGSIALLLGFLALAGATGSFEFDEIAAQSSAGNLANLIGSNLGWFDMPIGWLCALIFMLIFVGLAVKVPWVPLHGWLPDTYDHAPSPVTMVLTGLMSKMGLYGLIRMGLPMMPYALPKLLTSLLVLTVFGIVYSAFAAMGQRNIKRMFAYSSINHLGYCMLGILSLGVVTNGDMNLEIQKSSILGGIMLQMFAHGIIASVLFYFINLMENRIGRKILIDEHGGLRKVAPLMAGTMGLAVFASIGLPGLNGFVGEFLIFKGVFALVPWAACTAVVGLLITAVFLLRFLQVVFNGKAGESAAKFKDLSLMDTILVSPFIVIMVILGFFPHLLLSGLNPVINNIIRAMQF